MRISPDPWDIFPVLLELLEPWEVSGLSLGIWKKSDPKETPVVLLGT